MPIFSRLPSLVLPFALLPACLAVALPATPALAQAAAPAAAKPVAADNNVIPLPLTPIVPAGQRVCASRTPSGLGYTLLRSAPGPKPAAADVVLVNYVGYLAATGAVFDQGMQTAMPIADVIAGFGEGLQLIPKTGVMRLCIPAAIGYGARESGPIPANSDLVFQIELIDYKTAAEIEAMRKAQEAEQAPPEGATPQP